MTTSKAKGIEGKGRRRGRVCGSDQSLVREVGGGGIWGVETNTALALALAGYLQ